MFLKESRAKQFLNIRFPEYEIQLLEADYENPESYRTDLKEFFQAMQCRMDKNKLRELFQTEAFQHLLPDTERVIAVHLRIRQLVKKMDEEGTTMCKAFNDLMKEERCEGRKEGKSEGKREGRREEKMQTIRRMLKEGLDESLISRVTRCTKEELKAAAN